MADTGETSVRVLFVSMAFVMVGFVGLGLWYFLAPGEELDEAAGEYPNRAEVANIQDEEARDSLSRQLVLSAYNLERGPNVVSGTVVNNTDHPFVNVQVAFRLLDARGDSVGAVRDTTSIVEADDSWNFRVGVPSGLAVANVEEYDFQGTPKAPLGPQPRSIRRPEGELGPSSGPEN